MNSAPFSRRFDAVIFDLDGTLVDTLADIAAAMNAVLVARGFPEHPVEDYPKFVGDGALVLAQRTLPPGACDDEALARECALDYARQYARLGHTQGRAYDGIPELLHDLRRLGLDLAVLSNKPHLLTESCVAAFFPAGLFRIIHGQRPEVPRKPDPAGVREILRLLESSPERCLYVGDTVTDMETAAAAGLVSVGVAWGFQAIDDLRAAGASHLVRRPADILAVVTSPGGASNGGPLR